ncbi:hypothetical protein HGRIS_006237 [Hohenbuehelia grisea]|uniref:Telomere-associated protein Rif1 N-terminal domain-containing protein n=1 Tax=Hohenbuehelia grisea TaxID=104357 RepID=A0ABR3K1Y0_9AGAR
MSMSLPTPPSTSHRGKENRVLWLDELAQSSPQKFSPTNPSTPPRPILKKTAPITFDDQETSTREVTPEPSDPLVDLSYLENPVAAIVDHTTALRDLVEAYSVLAARLRACVTSITDADASWPIFQPLRKKRTEFVNAVIRDLGRALEELPTMEPVEVRARPLLPSPQNSPRKKKGMSAEAVKLARDLSTTTHAVIRFLALALTVPAIFRVFSDSELRDILTQVLAIPMANQLPTPNARKTCALATWLLQCQRLPQEVLEPVSTRIVFALRRGIDGELGKEGKKGSVSDGLKAVHDLSLYQPITFVPAFTAILPSILSALLGNTLTLRAQACYALGGFAYATSRLPRSQVHTLISDIVRKHITAGISPADSPSAKKLLNKSSPVKPASTEPAITRTLRTTLNATEPQHAAQGPVWALCVIASFIVLLGPAASTDPRTTRVIHALLSLAVRQKKSSVKGLIAAVWRCMTWAYMQPPLLPDLDEESEVEAEETDEKVSDDTSLSVRDNFWKMVANNRDLGAGVSTVWALVTASRSMPDSDYLPKAFEMLSSMIQRNDKCRSDALEIFGRLVDIKADADEEADDTSDEDMSPKMAKLLPLWLFSNNPGLLSADFNSLASTVRPILSQCVQCEAIPALTRDEFSEEWIYDELVGLWKQSLSHIQMADDEDPPDDIVMAWQQLLKAKLALLQDDNDAISAYAIDSIKVLICLFQDSRLDVRVVSSLDSPAAPSSSATQPSTPTKSGGTTTNKRTHVSLLLTVIHCLWSSMRTLFTHETLIAAAEKLLRFLVRNEPVITNSERAEWANLCADLMLVSDGDGGDLPVFWENVTGPEGAAGDSERKMATWQWAPSMQSLVWEIFAARWRTDPKGTWGGALYLLRVPFEHSDSWTMDDGDLESWGKLLEFALSRGLDAGFSAMILLDQIAAGILPVPDGASPAFLRVSDMLLSTYVEQLRTDGADIGVPHALLGMVNAVLAESYPPEPNRRVLSIWLLRTVVDMFGACPPELVLPVVEEIPDALYIWISDERQALLASEYADEIPLVYQSVLAAAQSIEPTPDALLGLEHVLQAPFVGRPNKPAALIEGFNEFWKLTFANIPEPAAGYSTRIRRCLGLPLEPVSEENDAAMVEDVAIEVDMPSEMMEVDAPEPVIRPTTPVPQPPSTPPRRELPLQPLAPTPFYHQERVTIFKFNPLKSPESPHKQRGSPSTPRRSRKRTQGISSPKNASPAKRRKLEFEQDKENEAPAAVHCTPVLAKSSPGKRRALGEPHDFDPSVLEKAKVPSQRPVPCSPSPSECEDERAVASLVLPSEAVQEVNDENFFAESSALSGPSRTPSLFLKQRIPPRKRLVLAAVEVPTLKEVYGNKTSDPKSGLKTSQSLDSGNFSFITPPTRRSLRLTMSDANRRRRRSTSRNASPYSTPTKSSSRSFMAKLLRAPSPLPEMQAPGSDDSIMASSSPSKALPSSDDQPRKLGQMTPHHLISPVPRRASTGSFDDDPPSDDSVIGASPSRELVTRRLERQNSLQRIAFDAAMAVMGVAGA